MNRTIHTNRTTYMNRTGTNKHNDMHVQRHAQLLACTRTYMYMITIFDAAICRQSHWHRLAFLCDSSFLSFPRSSDEEEEAYKDENGNSQKRMKVFKCHWRSAKATELMHHPAFKTAAHNALERNNGKYSKTELTAYARTRMYHVTQTLPTLHSSITHECAAPYFRQSKDFSTK